MSTKRAGYRDWLDDRLALSGAVARLKEHRVHEPAVEIYLAGASLVLFTLLIGTGVLLMMWYRPSVQEASSSVAWLSGSVRFGALLRAAHLWASDLLVLSGSAYAFVILEKRRYRSPGELHWIVALASLALVVALATTGSMLPWSETARQGAELAGSLARKAPLLGDWLARAMLGGQGVTDATLPRAFGWHVAVLPALLGTSIALLRLLAPRAWGSSGDRDAVPLYPDMLIRVAAFAVASLFAVVFLAMALPIRDAGRVLWYLAWLHVLLESTPNRMFGIDGARFSMGVLTALGVLACALPFLDPRGARWLRVPAWIVLVGLMVLTAYGLA